MVNTIILYLTIVSMYSNCKNTNNCKEIELACPNVKHYNYLKTMDDLKREANYCYMIGYETKLFKSLNKE